MLTVSNLSIHPSIKPPINHSFPDIFNVLIHNGEEQGGEYTYTRKNSNSYQPSYTSELMDSTDLRCNKGGLDSPSETYTVSAGDTVGFKLFYNEFIEHPGPGFVYVSKAPASVADYDGSGDWVKVMETGLCGNGNPGTNEDWCSWQKDRLEWTIQESIPDGEYLVRVEHIGLHQAYEGNAQFYIECFQLKIENGGDGTPGPAVQIPGMYSADDVGIAYNIYNSPVEYEMPGPEVWQG